MNNFTFIPNLMPSAPLDASTLFKSSISSFVSSVAKLKLFDKIQQENIRLKFLLNRLLKEIPLENEANSQFLLTRNNINTRLTPDQSPVRKIENHFYTPLVKSEDGMIKEEFKSLSSEFTEDTSHEISPLDFANNIKQEELHINNFKIEEDGESAQEFKIRRGSDFKQKDTYLINGSDKKHKISGKRRSKAKHLWVSYGRRIVEYAWKKTEGDIRQKIDECFGKLTSKKGYSEVFMIRKNDTEEDLEFKRLFGKLALEYIELEAEAAFLSSKYGRDFVDQKEKVSQWIRYLISF